MAVEHTSSLHGLLPYLQSRSILSHGDSKLILHFPWKSTFTITRNLTYRRSTYILPRNPMFTVHSSSNHVSAHSNRKLILINSAITVAFAVASRVFYKLALLPMKECPLFLAQFTTFGYVAIYFSILLVRYRSGIVTNEMIAIPKLRLMTIGILEALGLASGMAAGAMLPGPAIPVLNQTFLIWQLAFSTILLGRKYSFNQFAGCSLVAVGMVVAVASGSNPGEMLAGVEFVWPVIMILSSSLQAGSSIIKESVFLDAAKRLKEKSLDIFVVNSFGSGFQALFVLLFLPFLSNLKGIPFTQLPSYIRSGAACFINIGGKTPGCDGAPLLPLIFIATNITFNISLLNLIKMSSAVVASLAVMLSVPISIYALSLPLPYLSKASSLSYSFILGSVILVSGLILFNIPHPSKRVSNL